LYAGECVKISGRTQVAKAPAWAIKKNLGAHDGKHRGAKRISYPWLVLAVTMNTRWSGDLSLSGVARNALVFAWGFTHASVKLKRNWGARHKRWSMMV